MGQISLWSDEGKPGLEYLRNKRHLSDDVIKRFRIGYCPQEVNHRLAGRIIMPCFDAHDNLVALSTRDFNAPKKYQHWHESFDKSNYLYGINIAKKSIRWADKAIVVEGQFDVKCLHSFGLPMTVGLFGTNLSIMHIAMLARYCSEIYVVFDPKQREGDVSGAEGVGRAMQLYHDYCLSTYGIHFIPVSLPEQLDPDEHIFKHGKDAFTRLLDKRRNEIIYG